LVCQTILLNDWSLQNYSFKHLLLHQTQILLIFSVQKTGFHAPTSNSSFSLDLSFTRKYILSCIIRSIFKQNSIDSIIFCHWIYQQGYYNSCFEYGFMIIQFILNNVIFALRSQNSVITFPNHSSFSFECFLLDQMIGRRQYLLSCPLHL
jgi:hypothetical protein